jgi:uncharacterized protein (DUF433 family)
MNPETAAGMLNMGWQIDQIAEMHNANREQVIAAIREYVRQERAELDRLK